VSSLPRAGVWFPTDAQSHGGGTPSQVIRMPRRHPQTKRRSKRTAHRSCAPVIGIIGPIGAGKSAVAQLFASFTAGAVVISGDAVGHDVVERSVSLRRRLARAFGRDILSDTGIDRALLARRAFATKEANRTLNALVHPPLLRELRRRIRTARVRRGVPVVIVDAALLVEWGRDAVTWDRLIGVWAPERERLSRLAHRGWTAAEVRRRTRCQIPWREKRKHCDGIVNNTGSRAQLRRQAKLCWQNTVPSP